MESGRRDSEDTTSDSPTVGGMAESTRGMVAMAMGGGMVADMVASLAVAITIEADTDRGPASRANRSRLSKWRITRPGRCREGTLRRTP
jgi:hypothetical protein